MTDREMLECAAKAARLTIRDSNTWHDTVVRKIKMVDGSSNWVRWNPLNNDSDALRLAVQLGISGTWHQPLRYATGVHVPYGPGPVLRIEEHGTDPYDATRRAIVRAAAEIGRAMP